MQHTAPALAPQEPAVSGRGKWMVLIAAFGGWMFDGLEMGIFPQVARPSLTSLIANASESDIIFWHQVIDALFLSGAALGGLVFGWLGDKIGRVRAMTLSILAYSLFTGMCFFAQAPWHIGAFRFISAIGMGGEWSLGVALIMEVWPAKARPLLAGIIGAASNVGFLGIAFICYLFPISPSNWRYLMLAGAAPALTTLFIIFFVPESQKWQESQKKGPSSPLKEAFTGKTAGVMLLSIVFASIALLGTWGAVQKIPAWVGNIPVAGQRGATFRNGVLLGVEGKVEQGRFIITEALKDSAAARSGLQAGAAIEAINGQKVTSLDEMQQALKGKKPGEAVSMNVTVQGASTTVNVTLDKWSADKNANPITGMLLGIGAIFGCIIAPLMGAMFGRRVVYFALCLASLVTCGILFRGFDRYGGSFMFMTFLIGGVTAAFYGWLPLYLPELFPTRIRATAQGVAFNFGRIFAAGGALAGGSLVALWGDYARMGAAISLIYIAGMIVIWFAPETKGKPMPE